MKDIGIRIVYTKIPILGSEQFRKSPKGIEVVNINHTFTNENVGQYKVLVVEEIIFKGRLSKISPNSIEFELESLQLITNKDNLDLEKMIIRHRGGNSYDSYKNTRADKHRCDVRNIK